MDETSSGLRGLAEPGRMAIAAEVVLDSGDWSGFEPVDQLVESAVAALNQELGFDARVGQRIAVVSLADDAEVRRLNDQFREQDKPTNVLSFPADVPPGLPADAALALALGDVVLAVETIDREAAEMAIPPRHHLAHLVVHGILHLLGHDHETDAEADRMEALETAILAQLGIADPYDDREYALCDPAAVADAACGAETERQPVEARQSLPPESR